MDCVKRMLCRLLVGLMAWMPFSMAQAGMIETGESALPPAQVDRAAVTRQLQALGIDPAGAEQRIGAMSDAEIRALAQEIDSAPAGGWSRSASVLVLVIAAIAFVYWWNVRHPAK